VTALRDDALRTLTAWPAPDDTQERLRSAYVDHLRSHHDALLRTCVPAHLTASALVLDHTTERVLLTLHRKGGFWAQPGGHCEPQDETLAAAALREATEESGIAGLRLVGDAPVDLDRHALSTAFGTCGEHLDVRYAVVAPPGAEPVLSDESDDVAWFPAGAMPPGAVDDLAALVARAQAAVRSAQAPGWSAASPVSSVSSVSSVSPVSSVASASASSERPSPAAAETPSR
jgi:8-oxo-dGTP pyrophosphatase MutT (NUDIX family)